MPFGLPHHYPFHGLRQNRDLTTDEYDRLKLASARVTDLIRDWPGYIARHNLDPAVFHTQNEWGALVPVSAANEARCADDFSSINYIRLGSPFMGFHLPILDRTDGFRRFDDATTETIRAQVATRIPENIVELMDALDPQARLAHVVNEHHRLTKNLPPKYIVKTPPRGGEVGLVIDGVIVNPDTLITQARINCMYNLGILDFIEQRIRRRLHCRILEVGAGYGALATALHSIYPGQLRYIVIELPSVLWNTACYMGAIGPVHLIGPNEPFPKAFETALVANYLAEEYRGQMGPVDVAINTMSFIEMSDAQVRYYRDLMADLIGSEGKCFIEGSPSKPHHVDCAALFSETMPIRIDVPAGPAHHGTLYPAIWQKQRWPFEPSARRFIQRVSSHIERNWGSRRLKPTAR